MHSNYAVCYISEWCRVYSSIKCTLGKWGFKERVLDGLHFRPVDGGFVKAINILLALVLIRAQWFECALVMVLNRGKWLNCGKMSICKLGGCMRFWYWWNSSDVWWLCGSPLVSMFNHLLQIAEHWPFNIVGSYKHLLLIEQSWGYSYKIEEGQFYAIVVPAASFALLRMWTRAWQWGVNL